MSTAPSWLTEENINTAATVAKNPQVQAAAKNPQVQTAAKNALSNPPPPPPKSGAPKTPPANDVESGNNSSHAKSVSDAGEDFDPALVKEMQKYHLALRIGYIVAAAMMGTASVLKLLGSPDLGQAFFSIYIFVFAVLICCFEVALTMVSRMIAINFGFLYSLIGRAIFLLFVGFMCYSLGLYGIIAMAILYAVGLFHAYVMFKFPRFQEYLRKKHFFEGQEPSK